MKNLIIFVIALSIFFALTIVALFLYGYWLRRRRSNQAPNSSIGVSVSSSSEQLADSEANPERPALPSSESVRRCVQAIIGNKEGPRASCLGISSFLKGCASGVDNQLKTRFTLFSDLFRSPPEDADPMPSLQDDERPNHQRRGETPVRRDDLSTDSKPPLGNDPSPTHQRRGEPVVQLLHRDYSTGSMPPLKDKPNRSATHPRRGEPQVLHEASSTDSTPSLEEDSGHSYASHQRRDELANQAANDRPISIETHPNRVQDLSRRVNTGNAAPFDSSSTCSSSPGRNRGPPWPWQRRALMLGPSQRAIFPRNASVSTGQSPTATSSTPRTQPDTAAVNPTHSPMSSNVSKLPETGKSGEVGGTSDY